MAEFSEDMRRIEIESPAEIRTLLSTRAAREQRVALMTPKGQDICDGIIKRVHGGAMRVEIYGQDVRQFRSQPSLVMSFCDGSAAYTFLCRIEEFNRATKDNPASLELEFPHSIVGFTTPGRVTRHSFRIAVFEDMDIRAEVEDEDFKRYQVRVQDISLGGTLVEMRQNVPPSLNPRKIAKIILACEGETFELNAEVRTSSGSDLGLRFLGFGEPADLNPPLNYERFIARLEREWLRRKRER